MVIFDLKKNRFKRGTFFWGNKTRLHAPTTRLQRAYMRLYSSSKNSIRLLLNHFSDQYQLSYPFLRKYQAFLTLSYGLQPFYGNIRRPHPPPSSPLLPLVGEGHFLDILDFGPFGTFYELQFDLFTYIIILQHSRASQKQFRTFILPKSVTRRDFLPF